jgi:hypothetical protein
VRGWRRLLGREPLPEGFLGRLKAEERVLAAARVTSGGVLLASSLGLWLPEGRRIGWHLVSKATWGGGAMTVVEAEEDDLLDGAGGAGGADCAGGAVVLLRDLPPRRLSLGEPGALPEVVHKRVTGSIRSRHRRELPGGGAWFVQRGIPGRDGLVLQVRADPGTDQDAVRRVATQVARTLRAARG